jgi:hypothetical protein
MRFDIFPIVLVSSCRMSTSGRPPEFDISLCYVSEDNGYVTDVRGVLEVVGMRVLDDKFTESQFGTTPLNNLDVAYRDRSYLTVAFISQNYVRKEWVAPDELAAQVWAFNELASRFIAIRLDDAELPGLSLSSHHVDNRSMDIAKVVGAIKSRLDLLTTQPELLNAELHPRLKLPDGPEGRQQLIQEQPPGWRAAFKASIMHEGLDRLEPKWYDHQLGLRKVPGLHFRRHESAKFLQGHVLGGVQTMIQDFSSHIARNDSVEKSGDPNAIEQYAQEFVSLYEGLLDWAARTRGSSTPPNWSVMVQTSAQLADALLISVKEFVDSYAREAENLLNDVGDDAHDRKSLTLKFDLDSALLDILLIEYKKVHRG